MVGNPYISGVLGFIGILATFLNAYIPLRMLDGFLARRTSLIAIGLGVLAFSVTFSLLSAFGFAASARDKGSSDKAALSANYRTTLAQLKDAEAVTGKKRNQRAIDALREEIKRYRTAGAMQSDDPQAAALEALGIKDGRFYISLLLALLVEVGSAFGLYIAFADTTIRTIPRSRE
jgi:hypothetical protein